MNASWHRTHPMPKRAGLDQRVRWHLAHAKACACRPLPTSIRRALRAMRAASAEPGR
jgi:hypothetical protein